MQRWKQCSARITPWRSSLVGCFRDLTDEMLRANYRYLQLAEAADAERVRLLGEAAKDAVERCGRQHRQRRRTHRLSDKSPDPPSPRCMTRALVSAAAAPPLGLLPGSIERGVPTDQLSQTPKRSRTSRSAPLHPW